MEASARNVYSTTSKIVTKAISPEKESYAVRAAAAAINATANSTAAAAKDEITQTVKDAYRSAIDTARAAAIFGIDFSKEILQDLEHIINGNRFDEILIKSYGDIWTEFINCLENENCGYWGLVYTQLFGKNLYLNEDDYQELDRRVTVPVEIGEKGAAEVAKYLIELKKGTKDLNEARIIILGDKGVGKTCIARRLIKPSAAMTSETESTTGVDTSLWEPEGEGINIHIWDFAGHVVTHAVHQFFLSERCLYIIVYDGRTEERNRLNYWLDHMKNYGGNSRAMILVNLQDDHKPEIPLNNLRDNYKIEGCYEFSIQNDKEKVLDFRKNVIDYIKTHPSWDKQEIPESYYKVKTELEQIFIKDDKKNGEEYISIDRFKEISGQEDFERYKEILGNLHALGICLWYKDIDEYNTLVLNPEWISEGIYKIINWAKNKDKHCVTLKDFATIFKNDLTRYPEKKHPFLFKLMIHYELAFAKKNGKELVIPHLLHEDRPDDLPGFPVGESLMFRYKAEQPLPPNTISRFIVRHNQEIKKENRKFLVWRVGVVLDDGNGSIALVREEDRTISVSVKGKHQTSFIDRLRKTLNEIFNSYQSDKPDLQYKVIPYGELPESLGEDDIIWLQDRQIYNQTKVSVPYYDHNRDTYIYLNNTYNYYNIRADNILNNVKGDRIDIDSRRITFNFKDCNLDLQAALNGLNRITDKSDLTEDTDELKDAVELLKETKDLQGKDEVKGSGVINTLQDIIDKLNDEKTPLHKTVKGIKKGVKLAQEIGRGYNSIAQWVGLPQVPTPFLGKKEE